MAVGAETESPGGWVVEFNHGKAVRVSEYLDPKEALEAAGCPSSAAATALDDHQR